jgi:hypothetical protein
MDLDKTLVPRMERKTMSQEQLLRRIRAALKADSSGKCAEAFIALLALHPELEAPAEALPRTTKQIRSYLGQAKKIKVPPHYDFVPAEYFGARKKIRIFASGGGFVDFLQSEQPEQPETTPQGFLSFAWAPVQRKGSPDKVLGGLGDEAILSLQDLYSFSVYLDTEKISLSSVDVYYCRVRRVNDLPRSVCLFKQNGDWIVRDFAGLECGTVGCVIFRQT